MLQQLPAVQLNTERQCTPAKGIKIQLHLMWLLKMYMAALQLCLGRVILVWKPIHIKNR